MPASEFNGASLKMRSPVLRIRMRFACQAAAIVLVGGLAAGCSSDFTRFDRGLYASATPKVTQSEDTGINPYPDDLDTTTTSTAGKPSYGQRYTQAPLPVEPLAPRPLSGEQTNDTLLNDHVGGSAGVVQQGSIYPAAPPTELARSKFRNNDIERQTLPAPITHVQDASAAAAVGRDSGQGWSANGGTRVEIRSGETLYNLSKRYGVPVNEIMKANAIVDPADVAAGTMIVIPAYVYSPDAPVSAPDNNPGTRFARASAGSSVAPLTHQIPTPARKPAAPERHQANLDASSEPQDRSPVAGRLLTYRVGAGDTLAGIARDNRTTVTTLMAANGLTRANLKIGQELLIPADAGSSSGSATAGTSDGGRNASAGVVAVKPVDASTLTQAAPESTGIGEFRWPVRGRVISAFGEETAGNRNDGIDISVPEGTAVKAAENGVVVYAGDELEGFGNLVLVRHSDGWVSAYAHNKSIEVQRGAEVRRGEIIARSGRTGNADMPKLHFELRKNSLPVDPLKHLGGA
jgi:LysM repeat protein